MDSIMNVKDYALLGAVEAGNALATNQLLCLGANPNYAPNRGVERTLLHLALQENNFEIIMLLIQYGANIKEDFIEKIFNFSDDKVIEKIVAVILKHNDKDENLVKNCFKNLFKSGCRNPKVLELLLDYGLPVDNYIMKNNNEHLTPLHAAINRLNMDFISLLLERGADIHKKTSRGDSSLALAVGSNDLTVINIFLKKGAKVNERNGVQQTTLYRAISCSVVRILLNHGADINLLDKDGNSPLTFSKHRRTKIIYIKELAKMKFDYQAIHPKNLEHLKKNSDLLSIFANCLEELQYMKDLKIYNGLSLYDVLKMRKKMKKISLLTKRDEFVSALSSSKYLDKLSFYGYDLLYLFNEANDRRIAVETEVEKIYESGLERAFFLPTEITKMIAEFATDYLYFERGWKTEESEYDTMSESESDSESESINYYWTDSEDS